MSKTKIRFGTDGWRAIIAEDFTFENVRACAEGVARHIENSGRSQRGLVIGYDTRFASADFAAASAEVVAAHGIKVYLLDVKSPEKGKVLMYHENISYTPVSIVNENHPNNHPWKVSHNAAGVRLEPIHNLVKNSLIDWVVYDNFGKKVHADHGCLTDGTRLNAAGPSDDQGHTDATFI